MYFNYDGKIVPITIVQWDYLDNSKLVLIRLMGMHNCILVDKGDIIYE